MTYYETNYGAKVFAAGAFTLAGQALEPGVSRVLANLWGNSPGPRAPGRGGAAPRGH